MIKLGIDIDGTINNFNVLIYKYAELFNESQGIDLKADLSDWYLDRYFGWNSYQDNEFWAKHLKIAMNNSVPLPGAIDAISSLKQMGVEIYIITARLEKYRALTEQWLKKHNVTYDSLIMCSEKAMVCAKNKIDLMIDDQPENCMSISECTKVLCMEYPYNKHLDGTNNIKIVGNWDEAYSEIKSVCEERRVG